MLPDIRAVIAAMVAAVALLMATFGVVATLRVAQQHQSESLRADLAARGRLALPPNSQPAKSGERTILIVDTPGPHLATPVSSATPEPAPAVDPPPEPAPPVPAIAVQAVPLEPPVVVLPLPPADVPQPVEAARAAPTPPAETTRATPPAEIARTTPPAPPPTETTQATPPAEPPMGGPLAEPPRRQAETPRSDARDNPNTARRAAAEKARKARAARIARERKAAKRAATARRAKQPIPASGGSNTFGNINQVGGTFRQ
jgi:hypothetical protein